MRLIQRLGKVKTTKRLGTIMETSLKKTCGSCLMSFYLFLLLTKTTCFTLLPKYMLQLNSLIICMVPNALHSR